MVFLATQGCTYHVIQQQVGMIIDVLIWSRLYKLYRLLGMKMKEEIVWDNLGVYKCSLAAKCITIVTFELPEAIINLSLGGFPQTWVFRCWLPKL
jgi:hypothetical protein